MACTLNPSRGVPFGYYSNMGHGSLVSGARETRSHFLSPASRCKPIFPRYCCPQHRPAVHPCRSGWVLPISVRRRSGTAELQVRGCGAKAKGPFQSSSMLTGRRRRRPRPGTYGSCSTPLSCARLRCACECRRPGIVRAGVNAGYDTYTEFAVDL